MRLSRFLLPLILILGLTACQPAASASSPTPSVFPTAIASPITLTDGLERPVTLAHPAERIVSLAPSNTEILYALGAGPQVVGRDEFSDYPVEAKLLPSVGGSMGKYNLEAIANLKPDLVLAAGINTPEQVKSLEDLGLTVYYLSNPTDMEGMYTNLETLAVLTGQESRAAELVASLKKRVKAVDTRLAAVQTHPSVYYELDATDASRPYTAGPGTFVDLLIKRAGGTNIGETLTSSWAQIDQETILAENPDMILLGDAAYGVTPQSVAGRPGWNTLSAVKNNQVFTFDDNLVSRPTPRLVDGLETLAKIIHPEAFK